MFNHKYQNWYLVLSFQFFQIWQRWAFQCKYYFWLLVQINQICQHWLIWMFYHKYQNWYLVLSFQFFQILQRWISELIFSSFCSVQSDWKRWVFQCKSLLTFGTNWSGLSALIKLNGFVTNIILIFVTLFSDFCKKSQVLICDFKKRKIWEEHK